MKSENLNKYILLIFLALTVIASGCISNTPETDSNQEINQNHPEEAPMDDDSNDVEENSQTNGQEDSDEINQDRNTNNSQDSASETSFSYTGKTESVTVEAGGPTAIAEGPDGGYWVLANGFDKEENTVSRFTEDWQKTGGSHQVFPEEKIIYDLHYANGNWWILAGIQGKKEVFKYSENWDYTGESHEFSDDDIGSIFYDGKWKALGGSEGSTIFTFNSDWNRESSQSIKNSSLNNYAAIHKGENGGWKALASTSNYELVLIDFDNKWRFQNRYSLSKGTPEDLIQTEEGWWLLDSLNEEVHLYG